MRCRADAIPLLASSRQPTLPAPPYSARQTQHVKPNWFIGIPLVDDWVPRALTGVPRGLRTFRGEDIHITIAFLGAVGSERATAAWDAMIHDSDGARRTLVAPFDVTLGRVLPFGQPSQPSSLSVVPQYEAGPCTEFITRHRNRLRIAAGISQETRTVRPHATIVRIKRRAVPAVRQAALDWAATVPPLNEIVTLREVALYTWTDDRREQLFRIVQRAPLG